MQGCSDAFCFSTLPNGWAVGSFRVLEELDFVVHAVTTRRGLDVGMVASDHASAAAALSEALALDGVAWCEQVHGNEVLAVSLPGPAGPADALVTCRPNLGLMVRGADCPLILVADPVTGAVGAAHASWRGTVAGIACQLVITMGVAFGSRAEQMVACVCPSAGPCCYKVGPDVVAAAAAMGEGSERFFSRRDGAVHFDLWAANAAQLAEMGVQPQNIHVAGVCTICRNDLFPSYRVEGASAGRFAAVIASR